MPIYHKLGQIPSKRHIQFRQPDGSLYQEELFGTIGFDGMSSLMYHIHMPTSVKEFVGEKDCEPIAAVKKNLKTRLLSGFDIQPTDDYLDSRKILMFNADVTIAVAAPKKSTDSYFFKNSDSDELLFVHRGTGKLKTQFGSIPFEYGDYLIIPRGVIYQIEFETEDNKLLVLESKKPIYTPKRYRNYFGQMLESSPFCERDYKLPENLETFDEKGDFLVKIKKQNTLYDVIYPHHPFDLIGWDGYNYPYGFSIHNFEPITGRIHQPPPVHQNFETTAFVVCSFCPRLYDYHHLSIPASYNHSNIDSDELLYYVDGDFMSRNNIKKGNFTLHPMGIPHGPAPGAYERSIGKKETLELAVMIDTFSPLQLTADALKIEDENYYKSWMI